MRVGGQHDIVQMLADIIRRDVQIHIRHFVAASIEGDILQQLLKHRVQPARANILPRLIGQAGSRGNGLQRILLEDALPLLRPGIVGIGATVSPGNPYSLNNAKASGFEIVSRREMYGGHDRYLLAKHL